MTSFGQGWPSLHVSQKHLPRWPWLAKQRFFGFVFEKQWTSLALPATGLQFLAGNGPFLALLQTRPAAAPHLQHPNGPPWAEKAPKRANHQPIGPPVHGKASWGLATPNAGHLVWPPNLACSVVGHFAHSTAVSPLVPRLAAPAHLAQEQKWQNQPKWCATTLWGGNLAVVWGSGSQHGRFERYDKIRKTECH